MNCPQEECEGCTHFEHCDKPQAWDYQAELMAEVVHDPMEERLDELSERLDAVRSSLWQLREEFDRVIAAVRRASMEEAD